MVIFFNCGLLRIHELHHVLVIYLTLYQFVHLRSEIAWYVCYCVEEVFEAFWPFLYGLQSLHCGYDAGSMMMMMFAACAEYSVWIILRTRLILALLKSLQSKSHQKNLTQLLIEAILILAKDVFRNGWNSRFLDFYQFQFCACVCENWPLNSQYFWKWTNANPMNLFNRIPAGTKL